MEGHSFPLEHEVLTGRNGKTSKTNLAGDYTMLTGPRVNLITLPGEVCGDE